MQDDNQPIGYDDLDDDQKEALSLIQKSMSDYDRGVSDAEKRAYEAGFHNGRSGGISEATDSLSKRIVALEILCQQKDMKIRHLTETISDMKSGLTKHDGRRPWAKPINPKDEQ